MQRALAPSFFPQSLAQAAQAETEAATAGPQAAVAVQRKCTACQEEDAKLHRQEEPSGEKSLHGKADTSAVQPKLDIAPPDDPQEREADRVADTVMRMPAADAGQRSAGTAAVGGRSLFRKGDQTAAKGGTTSAPDGLPSALRSLRGNGQPLPAPLRNSMESRFGEDFGTVRIHANSASAAMAKSIHAQAFTHGSDIVFGPNAYAPHTPRGDRLLAHELTHVVQQRRDPQPGIVSRAPVAYEDCSEATTGEKNWKSILDHALKRADDFVDAALCALARDPATEPASSAYPLALQRHFLGSSFALRKTLLANFLKIRNELKPEKIRCVKTDADQASCLSEKGLAGAFATKGQDWLCPTFWSFINRNCMAGALIHEAAHLIGLGLGTPHPPYRGGDDYPFGGKTPKAGQTTATRMDNPDAYAYFAMHVWREIDSECYVMAELIQVTNEPPTTPSTPPGEKK